MSYADQQNLTGGKIAGLVIAVALNVGLVLALVFGLTISAVKEQIERVTTINVEEEPPPPPPDEPPPEPQEQPQPTSPPPPVAPPPPFDIAPNPPVMQTTPTPPPPQPTFTRPSTPQVAPPGPPTPPRPPSKARGVQPKNQRSWAARIQENYPARALREEIEGTVGVRVTVTAEGRATGCSVTASSGSSILDDAACKDLERYGRFDPALNDAGNPTSASWSTRITYKLS